MFDELTKKLEYTFQKLKGHGKINEKNISEALREVRRTLLEADVNYKVAKDFIEAVKNKSLGKEVLRSITPAQQVIKIFNEELVDLLGGTVSRLKDSSVPPTKIMVAGLQGSGKTTFCAKLSLFLSKKGKKSLLASSDIYRPAAKNQLEVLGNSINTFVYPYDKEGAVEIAVGAVEEAKNRGYDVVILDTAGRLHINSEMMDEVVEIKNAINPNEILFVADGMTGQDAVNSAKAFLERLDFTGIVLTKLDGDAKGGAALSIRAVTGRPIKFISIGEKVDAIDIFHPDRMASRILGMGDIITLVEKAEEAVDREKALKLEKKLRKEEFTLEDFYDQLQQIKRMGPIENLIEMIPGVRGLKFKDIRENGDELKKTEAIINSMTPEERRKPKIINGSRRLRIARGSGTSVQDVNRLLKQFSQMQKMIKGLSRFGFGKVFKQFGF
ncbi:signal recognition particle protein [candidate division KSB1 bacterium]|mgnify:CR=1 FL=1|nr:MAG: signal recognition particle protein [candidate division KSB1 bacterium]